ncbi:glycosyltransferase family 2 protein [Paenibacillus flagellatus]|uniref:Glycosyl transferase family 2 n=1 Tax=Paenibacillus flagellatus TaxID=2211139 RepID=A0A2V5K2W3_9BACL|nr:glycosyltransferase [Paenibacillus flagellatus]PYI53558.1 glycosyl transferase family 2 [Paenibacillus flagellatus]
MLVFILVQDNAHWLETTLLALSQANVPDCSVLVLEADYADRMNRALADYEGRFFIALTAGDRPQPDFGPSVAEWIRSLPDTYAGIEIVAPPRPMPDRRKPPDASDIPVVWSTKAVRSGLFGGGFLPPDALPFDHYVLLERRLGLGETHPWRRIESACIVRGGTAAAPAWRRLAEEWDFLRPVLTAAYRKPESGDSPVVTVVISTYNDARYLLWAVRSVLVQSFQRWELLIVDDGSDDDTIRKLEKLPCDDRIVVMRNRTNRGKSACLNAALARAKGRWLLELDADDWLSPDCLETLLSGVNEQECCGAAVGLHAEWLERPNRQPVYRRPAPFPDSVERILTDGVPLAPRMYRMACLRELGGWLTDDPYDGRLYEDFQMLLRLNAKYPIRRVPRVLYHRRLRSGSVTHSHPGRYEVWRRWMELRLAADSGD